jgi:hypothetical protein
MSISLPKIYETQLHFQPKLPHVEGCKEYDDYKSQLERIDHFLDQSGTQARFLEESLKDFISKAQKDGREPKLRQDPALPGTKPIGAAGQYRQDSG